MLSSIAVLSGAGFYSNYFYRPQDIRVFDVSFLMLQKPEKTALNRLICATLGFSISTSLILISLF